MGMKYFILKEFYLNIKFFQIHLKWPEARGKGGVNGPPYTSLCVKLKAKLTSKTYEQNLLKSKTYEQNLLTSKTYLRAKLTYKLITVHI